MEREEYKKYVHNKFQHEAEIWKESNRWSSHTKLSIGLEINKFLEKYPLTPDSLLVNAGSGNISYFTKSDITIDCDIVFSKLDPSGKCVVADIEHLPFNNALFSHVICMGSVINYTDPIQSIFEISRVLKKGGYLLIDFDSSSSWEFLFTENFNKPVRFIKTFYNDKEDNIYIYSPNYMRNMLLSNNIQIIGEGSYHTLSPLIFKLTKKERLSGIVGVADKYLRMIPMLKKLSASMVLICIKN